MAFTSVNICSYDGAETSLHSKGIEPVMLLSRAVEVSLYVR